MDERRAQSWKALPFPISRRVSVTTGDDLSLPLFRAPGVNCFVVQFAFLPVSAWSADAAHFWTLSLTYYDEAGTLQGGMPFDERTATFALDELPLAVGRPLRLPILGRMEERLLADWTLHLKIAETGTAAALDGVAQVDILIGG